MIMRQVSVFGFALAALMTAVTISPLAAEFEPGGPVKVDQCASDPKLLGVSRIVEIDTKGGAQIGSGRADATNFLKDGEVVLTFDDGPIKAPTSAILKALADQCTKATFFMVGQMALSNPAMVREVAAAGHTIGTHTWSHKNMRAVNFDKAQQEIESAISMVSKAKGSPVTPLFRFPYLSSNRKVESYLDSRNIAAVWIDVDSKDYLTRSPRVVEQRIMAQLIKRKKGIILMHDIHAWTAKMLPDLLKDLHEHGFKVVHIVPKGPVETLEAFDVDAEKVFEAKTAAKNANPMAPRSVVWSMTPAPGAKQKPAAKKTSTKPAQIENAGAANGASATPAKAKKPAKQEEGFPWQMNFFN